MKSTNRLTKTLLGAGLAVALGFAIAAGNPAAAQTWTELSPTGGPPPIRAIHTAVRNPANNRMIVFAGLNGAGLVGVDPSLNDVWVLENADGLGGTPTWSQLFPTGGPPALRVGHSAVYDPGNNRMTVFAGNLSWAFCGGTANDVWVLENADGLGGTPNWTALSPTGGPPSSRTNHSAIYDPATNRMIVFGGSPACGGANNQVWVLTNANGLGGTPNWTLLAPTGGPITGRAGHIAAYDQANNRMIVVGGSGVLMDVWALENANGLGGTPNWVQLFPTGGPPSTFFGRGVYNPTTNQLISFGGLLTAGSVASNEVWVLDNANGLGGTPNWTQLSPTGGPPHERFVHTAVLNVGSNRMTAFGGSSNITGVASNDTWVLDIPDVEVTPTVLDFGNVPTGNFKHMIATIQNVGAVSHTITGISIVGDPSFSESSPATPVVLGPGNDVDVTVTYLPTSVALEGATLSVTSDEGTIDVTLIGNGLESVVTDQATVLETNINDAISGGTLIGSGSGKSAAGRLGAFVNMIEAAGDLIEAGFFEDACGVLRSALRRVDGEPRPPDFVAGADAEFIEAEIIFLMDSIGCS